MINKHILGTSFVLGLIGVFCFSFSKPVSSHGVFKDKLEQEVEGLRATCYACHLQKEPKTVRNEFGELFFQQFEGMDLSARWDATEGDDEAREKFEQEVMAPAFVEALKVVGDKKNAEGIKYSVLIKEGKIEGTKMKKKK
ncbi:MAG TPA: hypothetical protein PKD64_09750 [Pirellulaceae bacterium]|nr:hypothetical protein [Pirellulaceae bacterium]HMO92469.1 hypothetical protein [Pirellulaceae bacterium]HMP67861.1 hypothetical protein [Pirellulaceae bacterium]